MLLSATHGYIFAACSKNASTSVEGVLAPGADISLTRPDHHKHLPVRGIRREFADVFEAIAPWEEFLSFGIIRDPLRRLISKFNYRSSFKKDHKLYCGGMSFDEFVEEFTGADPRPAARVDAQAHFFGFRDGQVQVDVVLRIENLAQDAAMLGTRLGCDLAHELAAGRKNEGELKRVSLKDISEDTRARLEKKLTRDRTFHEWVSARHAAGDWAKVADKPAPAVDGAALEDFFREKRPELWAESLFNKLRLTPGLSEDAQAAMLEEIRAFDPGRGERAAGWLSRQQAA